MSHIVGEMSWIHSWKTPETSEFSHCCQSTAGEETKRTAVISLSSRRHRAPDRGSTAVMEACTCVSCFSIMFHKLTLLRVLVSAVLTLRFLSCKHGLKVILLFGPLKIKELILDGSHWALGPTLNIISSAHSCTIVSIQSQVKKNLEFQMTLYETPLLWEQWDVHLTRKHLLTVYSTKWRQWQVALF